jgi:hypothetical protein
LVKRHESILCGGREKRILVDGGGSGGAAPSITGVWGCISQKKGPGKRMYSYISYGVVVRVVVGSMAGERWVEGCVWSKREDLRHERERG